MSVTSERFATIDHGTVESVARDMATLTTIDGLSIVADVETVPNDVPALGAVTLAHPHPLYGGNRFNPVVSTLFERLPQLGFHTLRFDFRGVNDSEGEHDDGNGERLDVAASIDWLSMLVDDATGGGVWVVGYSFGALVGLSVVEPRVAGWVAIAPPLSPEGRVLSSIDPRPTLMVVPRHDQFCPPERATDVVAGWPNTELVSIEMADHFLAGRVDDTAELVGNWLAGRVSDRELR